MINTAFLGAAFGVGDDMRILQYINTEITSTNIFVDVALDDTVDLTKSWIVILNASSTVTNRVGNMVIPTFVDENTARFTKGDADGGSNIVAVVVSSTRLVSLQYVTASITLSNPSVSIAITEVDSVNNLVVPFMTGTRAGLDGANSGVFEVWPTFTPSATMTSITANRNSTGGTSPIGAYIAELRR